MSREHRQGGQGSRPAAPPLPLVDELAREWRPGRNEAADDVMLQLIEIRDSLLQGSAS